MGITTKLAKIGYGLISSKGSRRVVKTLGGSNKMIKTTAQTIGSKIPAIAGGKVIRKTVARSTAKALSGVASVGGKVAKTGIILGGTAGILTLGGAKIYDYVGDVSAMTPELRQYEKALDLVEKEKKLKDDSDDDSDVKTSDGGDMSSDDMSQSGGGDKYNIFNRIFPSDETKQAEASADKTGSFVFGAVALAAIGTGIYLYKKSKK